jgi:predicted nucleotidyltransferase
MDTCIKNFITLDGQVFNFLCLNAGESFTQRDIAKQLNVSPTAIGHSIKKLFKNNFIQLNKLKTQHLISLQRDNPLVIRLKKIENLKTIYLSGLVDYLEEQLPATTIILFGSYAKGEDTASSDIDMAIIGRKPKPLSQKIFEKTLQRQININFYTSYKTIDKNLKNNILSGIVLYGCVNL